MNPSYSLTNHAIDRMVERSDKFRLQYNATKSQIAKRTLAQSWYEAATEDRAFLNNSTFCVMLVERYPNLHRWKMFVYENLIFLGATVIGRDRNVIVTVLDKSSHFCKNVAHSHSNKFKKPKKVNQYEQSHRV